MQKTCTVCGKEYETRQSTGKYCGRKCKASAVYHKAIACHIYTCEQCGKEFHPKAKDRTRFCSRECSFASMAVNKAARDEVKALEAPARRAALIEERKNRQRVCRHCGKMFNPVRTAVCCSDGCYKADANKKTFEVNKASKEIKARACKGCGNVFTPEYGNKRRSFCSDVCSSRYADRVQRKKLGGNEHRHRARHHGVEYEPVNVLKVFARDSWTCQICGCKTPERLRGKNKPRSPELDHRVPMSKGGGHTYSNVQCACRSCNGAKGNSNNAGQIPLFN